MARNKKKELKDFLISVRKRVSPGVTSAPVWVLQKAGKRIWNKSAKRHWRRTEFGLKFRKRLKNKMGRKRKR